MLYLTPEFTPLGGVLFQLPQQNLLLSGVFAGSEPIPAQARLLLERPDANLRNTVLDCAPSCIFIRRLSRGQQLQKQWPRCIREPVLAR